jgi:hypothetical protein
VRRLNDPAREPARHRCRASVSVGPDPPRQVLARTRFALHRVATPGLAARQPPRRRRAHERQEQDAPQPGLPPGDETADPARAALGTPEPVRHRRAPPVGTPAEAPCCARKEDWKSTARPRTPQPDDRGTAGESSRAWPSASR